MSLLIKPNVRLKSGGARVSRDFIRKGVLEHVRNSGKLPDHINTGGFHVGMNILIRKRGTDITLTDDEQLVLDAILREKRLPGGGVVFIED